MIASLLEWVMPWRDSRGVDIMSFSDPSGLIFVTGALIEGATFSLADHRIAEETFDDMANWIRDAPISNYQISRMGRSYADCIILGNDADAIVFRSRYPDIKQI
jgi:hypothetical protein